MKFESQYDRYDRCYSFRGVVPERDILENHNMNDIVLRIRAEIAQQVADRIMERLGPAIDEAFCNIKAADGRYIDDTPSGDDLVEVPEKRRLACWLNVYEHARHNECWPTKAEADLADRRCNRIRIACIDLSQLEYEVGEGLE